MNLPPAIDTRVLDELRALNPDDSGFLKELVELFLRDIPERMQEIDQAIATQNAALLTRAAHTIKGSCSNFGARHLSQIAQRIEADGKAAALSAALPSIEELKVEHLRVAEALTQVVKD